MVFSKKYHHFYVQRAEFNHKKELINFHPSADQIFHIKNVLKIADDKKVVVIYQNQKYWGKIQLSQSKPFIKVIRQIKQHQNSNFKLNLYLSLIKSKRWKILLEKASELGATSITPLITARCNVKMANDQIKQKYQHWNKIIIKGGEQSESNTVPFLKPLLNKTADLDLKNNSQQINFVLSPHHQQPFTLSFWKKIMQRNPKIKTINLLIGPEGGWTETEINFLKTKNIIPIQVADRILRSETAAMYILSVFHFLTF